MPTFDYLTPQQGPNIDTDLFARNNSAGINAGNALPTPLAAGIRGGLQGLQQGLNMYGQAQEDVIRQNQIAQLPVTNEIQSEQLKNDQLTNSRLAQTQDSTIAATNAKNTQSVDQIQREQEFTKVLNDPNTTPQAKAQAVSSGQWADVMGNNPQLGQAAIRGTFKDWEPGARDAYLQSLGNQQRKTGLDELTEQATKDYPTHKAAFNSDDTTRELIGEIPAHKDGSSVTAQDLFQYGKISRDESNKYQKGVDGITPLKDANEKPIVRTEWAKEPAVYNFEYDGPDGTTYTKTGIEKQFHQKWGDYKSSDALVRGLVVGQNKLGDMINEAQQVDDAKKKKLDDATSAPPVDPAHADDQFHSTAIGHQPATTPSSAPVPDNAVTRIVQQARQQFDALAKTGNSSYSPDALVKRAAQTAQQLRSRFAVKPPDPPAAQTTTAPAQPQQQSSDGATQPTQTATPVQSAPAVTGAQPPTASVPKTTIVGTPAVKTGSGFIKSLSDAIIAPAQAEEFTPSPQTTADVAVSRMVGSPTRLNVDVPLHVKQQTYDRVQSEPLLQGQTALIKGLATVESGGNPRAKSGTGVHGILQVTKATAAQYGLNRDIPSQNLEAGKRTLSDNLHIFDGDLKLALTAYNVGPGVVREAVRNAGTTDWSAVRSELQDLVSAKKFKEVNGYADKVISAAAHYMDPDSESDQQLLLFFQQNNLLQG